MPTRTGKWSELSAWQSVCHREDEILDHYIKNIREIAELKGYDAGYAETYSHRSSPLCE